MNWLIEEDPGGAVVVKMSSNKLNLMNDSFFDDLNYAFDILENDYPDRPVILTSIGNVFSAGLDINHCYTLFRNGDMEEIRIWFEHFRDSLVRAFSFERPLIGAVNGHAIAGGLVLALCCDIRIVSSADSKFGLNEVKVGFPLPATIADIIKHSLGTPVAEELIYKSSLFGPQDALEYGIFHELADPAHLMTKALDQAVEFADIPCIESYSHAKKALRAESLDRIRGLSMDIDEEMPDILASEKTVKSLERVLKQLKKD